MKHIRAACLAAATILAACSGGDRTPVVVYSPHGRDLLELLEKTYEAAHPEIDVRWLDMGSQKVLERIRSEAANPQADVWFGGPSTIFAQGAKAGLLAPYRPGWADAVPAASRHPEGLYHGVFRSLPVLVYNTNLVPETEAPTDWASLLEPRFTGKVLMRDPLESGTMRTVFGMVLARSIADTGSPDSGFAWLARLDAQTKEYVPDPILMLTKLVRGEGTVTVWDLTDILFQRDKKAPLAYRFPNSGTPVIDDAIGLVAQAPHPEAARAFIEWVGSPEALRLAAEKAYRVPARSDLPASELPPWAQEVLAALVPATYDATLVTEHGPEWMARWDRTVRGRGSVAP
ncbi:MAG: extracellular solute-binding protein [Thermoanaerobaculia bacterium]|nr:extracellular solute-binding protein [Thermoanaerobaculia bacterium]